MKNGLIFFLTFFIYFEGVGQNIVIADTITKKAIPHAIIYYGNNGFYTNSQGEFSISEIKNTDTIEISHLQYVPKKISLSKIDTIYLQKASNLLNEIRIQNKKNKLIKPTRKSKSLISFPLTESMEILLKLVPHKDIIGKTLRQTTVEYRFVNSRDGINDNFNVAFRFNFYKAESNKVSSLIYSCDPIEVKPQKKGNITTDLKDTYIELPESGIFIGIEFIGYFKENKPVAISNNDLFSLVLTDQENEFYSAKTYYRYPLQNNKKLFLINETLNSQLPGNFKNNLRIELIVSD